MSIQNSYYRGLKGAETFKQKNTGNYNEEKRKSRNRKINHIMNNIFVSLYMEIDNTYI